MIKLCVDVHVELLCRLIYNNDVSYIIVIMWRLPTHENFAHYHSFMQMNECLQLNDASQLRSKRPKLPSAYMSEQCLRMFKSSNKRVKRLLG